MCASYGLDPRFTDEEYRAAMDAAMLDGLRDWAEDNADETLRITGIRERRLLPLFTDQDELQLAWWGYLVGGRPSKFASHNTRTEKLRERKVLPQRALAPASCWFEMQKPSRQWHTFQRPHHQLFLMAAVTQPGRTFDGDQVTCYSLLMQDAPERLHDVHDRMPLLIPASFAHEWLTSTEAPGILIDAAIDAAAPLIAEISAHPQEQSTLF